MSGLFKLKDHFKENKLYLNRTVTATAIVFALLMVLIARLIYLQIDQHDIYVTMARNNHLRLLPIPPTRGLIYDRNGILLAENLPTFSLEITPSRTKNLTELIDKLSNVIPISENDIKTFRKQLKYKGVHEGIPIRNKLSNEEVAKFSIERHNYPEAEIVGRLSRYYPHGETFAHVLGYLGPISETDLTSIDIAKYRSVHQIGKVGVEKSYEEMLYGKIGYEQVETDVRGRIVRKIDTTKPIPGSNVYLTIDSNLQILAQQLFAGRQGAIIMLEVKTGEILVLTSSPSYDPNLFVQGIDQDMYYKLQNNPDQPLFNRAIRGQYPPGSTVKPLVALQALEHRVINREERIYDPGYYQLRSEGRLYRDWRERGHGFMNLENALAESCSTFFYYLADKLGIDRIYEIYSKFGLGDYLGIDIQGEAAGIAPSPPWKQRTKNTAWFPGETLMTGIGQGYTLATPLQIAHVAATIANRGYRRQPHLVQAIEKLPIKVSATDNNNDINNFNLTNTITNANKTYLPSKVYAPVKLKNEHNWDIVINGMELVVKSPHGTAHPIYKSDTLRIAGKTGTAQVFGLKQDEKYVSENIDEHLRDHGWFMAFAPVEDPEIAVVVIFEHSKGSPAAARKLIDEYYKLKSKTSVTTATNPPATATTATKTTADNFADTEVSNTAITDVDLADNIQVTNHTTVAGGN